MVRATLWSRTPAHILEKKRTHKKNGAIPIIELINGTPQVERVCHSLLWVLARDLVVVVEWCRSEHISITRWSKFLLTPTRKVISVDRSAQRKYAANAPNNFAIINSRASTIMELRASELRLRTAKNYCFIIIIIIVSAKHKLNMLNHTYDHHLRYMCSPNRTFHRGFSLLLSPLIN